jgi:magnesium transporter
MGEAFFRRDETAMRAVLPKVGNNEITEIIEGLDHKGGLKLFLALPEERRAKIALELGDSTRDGILSALPRPELKGMIDAAESDVAVDLIQLLSRDERDRVMAELRKADPRGLLPLLVFGEETAGGRMKTEIMRVRDTATVGGVREMAAKEWHGRIKSHYVYVVDRDDAYLGRFAPVRLLQFPPETRITEVMKKEAEPVLADLDQEEVAARFDEVDAVELPVVNGRGRLLGCITADDIFEVMEEEYSEDIARTVGAGDEASISDPMLVSSRRRVPWLAVNLATAFVAASVIGSFRDTVQEVVMLAAFMPIIAGIGGNAAQQSLGLTIRAIATDEIGRVNALHAIVKEVAVGALNGFLVGLAAAAVALAWTRDPMLAAVVVLAMVLNLIAAGLVGVAVPLAVRFFRGDPALGSTIFVTAVTDSFGFFAFLGLASIMLG